MRDVLVVVCFFGFMQTGAGALIDYLRQLEARGVTHVNVDDEARALLREFYLRARSGGGSHAVKQAQDEPVVKLRERVEVPETNDNAVEVRGESAAEKIRHLKQQAENWQPARQLGTLRQTMVFSVGNPEADVMLVGEAPGYDEERLREPFVGKAGQKLNGILAAMGLEREACYISNIVKFRPSMPNQTTNNRKPTTEEMVSCMPFIEQEVAIVRPKVIVALGGTAAQALLGVDHSVAKMRGAFHEYQGIALRVTYHPSYILHNEATSEKRKLWEDMLEVMKLLEMPISDKQQSYFLPKS